MPDDLLDYGWLIGIFAIALILGPLFALRPTSQKRGKVPMPEDWKARLARLPHAACIDDAPFAGRNVVGSRLHLRAPEERGGGGDGNKKKKKKIQGVGRCSELIFNYDLLPEDAVVFDPGESSSREDEDKSSSSAESWWW